MTCAQQHSAVWGVRRDCSIRMAWVPEAGLGSSGCSLRLAWVPPAAPPHCQGGIAHIWLQ